jgi:hypothetical protein
MEKPSVHTLAVIKSEGVAPAPKDLVRQRRAIRQKRGQGEGLDYVPFIMLGRHEFASHGLSVLQPSIASGRSLHLLSALECATVLYLETLGPKELREQYPLRLVGVEPWLAERYPEAQGTLEIARAMKVPHPQFSREEPRVMTTDLVALFLDGRVYPVYVKYSKDLEKDRTQEMLEIERTYWKQRGAQLGISTEKDIHPTVLSNLKMVRSYQKENLNNFSVDGLAEVAARARDERMNLAIRRTAAGRGIASNCLTDHLKFAIASGQARLQLTKHLNWTDFWPPIALVPQVQDSFELELELSAQ